MFAREEKDEDTLAKEEIWCRASGGEIERATNGGDFLVCESKRQLSMRLNEPCIERKFG